MSLDSARHLTRRDWGRARKMYEAGVSPAEIAQKFAVPSTVVGHMARRERWANAADLTSEQERREQASDAALAPENSPPSGQRMKLPSLDCEQTDAIRRNLVVARVTSGLSQMEAAVRLGYENSTQLSLIESGRRPVPAAATFLIRASQTYGVSVDWLAGLSPVVEPDGKLAREHAILRQTESIAHGVAATLAAAMVDTSAQAWPLMAEYQRLLDLVQRVDDALNVMRERFGFDNAMGGAPLLRAVEEMADAARPLRSKLSRFRSTEQILADLKAGRAIVPEHLGDLPALDANELSEQHLGEVRRALSGRPPRASNLCREDGRAA